MPQQYELVGIAPQLLGIPPVIEGWVVTYEKEPAEEDGGIPNFHHHYFPAVIFYNYAEEFGLDIDDPDDFDDILDIVLHEAFVGDNPVDDIEPPQAQGLLRAGKQDKKNKLGRKMRRRAERAKVDHEITGMGIDGIRDRLRSERHRGVEQQRNRIQRLQEAEARHARSALLSEGGSEDTTIR